MESVWVLDFSDARQQAPHHCLAKVQKGQPDVKAGIENQQMIQQCENSHCHKEEKGGDVVQFEGKRSMVWCMLLHRVEETVVTTQGQTDGVLGWRDNCCGQKRLPPEGQMGNGVERLLESDMDCLH